MKKKLAIGITALLSSGCLFGGVMSLNAMETVGATETNLWMEKGASVRLSEPTGIGFITRIDYEYYNSLSDKDVVTGTIILPTDYLTDNSITTITHATLNEFGADGTFYQDIENDGFKNEATAEADGYFEYRGSLAPLNVKNYDRAFSAVGYIGVKEVGETEYVYEYTAYSETDHSRAVEDVAFSAYVDRTETEQTVDKVEYKYAVSADGTYSPYTADELTILSGYMRDTTVAVADTAILQKENGILTLSDLEETLEGTDANFKAATFGNVTRNDKSIVAAATEATEADVSLNGIYNIEVNGTTTYEATGAKIPATMTVSVDVWSEKTKNLIVALEDYFSIAGYGYQSFIKDELTVGEYTLGGKTETLLRVFADGRECSVVVANPLHSKKYYQEILAKDGYYTGYVTLDWYFENTGAHTSDVTPYYDMFTGYEKLGAQEKDTWHSGRITLDEFLALYDDMVAIYERTVNEYNTGVRYGRFVDVTGVVDQEGNVQSGYVMATKFQTNRVDCAYFAPMTFEIGEMNTIETTELVDRSTTTAITPSLTADEQKVVDFWTEQGYTISYEFVKRYSDGTPIFKGNDIATLGTYNVTETTEDGIYYLNVKATKEAVSDVCLQKAYDIYNSTEAIVEYENFKHTDSEYAIRIYWVKFATQPPILYSGKQVTMAMSDATELGATLDKVEFGTGTDANTLYILRKDKTTLNSGSDSMTAIKDTNYSGREVGYIAYNWNSEDTQTKLDSTHSNETSYQYIYTYVLPRHSKLYYQTFANVCGNFEMAFKSTNSDYSGVGRMRYVYMTDIVDGAIAMRNTENVWSSNNQSASSNITANIGTIIENYEVLAAGKVPMIIMMHMIGTTVSETVDAGISYESRLYEMGFHKTVTE